MPGPARRPLGELESAALSALWDSTAPLSVREVQQRLGRLELAYTTVLTVLDRLHDKGIVARERDGRAFLYRPSLSREAWQGEHAARVLTGERSPPSGAVLMAFLDSAERADPELIERLSDLIAARRKGAAR